MSLEKKIITFLKGPKKGEAYELKSGLVSQYKHERKDAIQRVIQAMTIGKDVSALFPEVLKNIATYDLEQKKLVYLYLMNYAKSNPELCILAVNTFVQDTEDPNPLVRALAIRTMGCVRVARMVDYMEVPLRRTLEDDNPYVRKTAAICVAKLYDLNLDMCVELGFFDALKRLLQDPNPMVVANALSALHEIRDMAGGAEVVVVDKGLVLLLLACLNECSEWGRITILSYLAEYSTNDADEALRLVERVIPQLQHVNPSVVLASIKVVLHHLESLPNATQRTLFLRKLSAPMVSLASLPIPEAQYVGLKNIRIILEKYPSCLPKELRVFFVKYSDPLYLKVEKLDILVRLASDANSPLLLSELREYAMEFEPALVTKAVNAIGAVAIKLVGSVIVAVNLLVALMDQRGGETIINESAVVLTQILRRYPGRNDLITLVVPVISEYADTFSSSAALSGYVFLIGEYPKYFTGLRDKLQQLLDDFITFDASLQLTTLTAIVKVCTKLHGDAYALLLQQVLDKATKECDNVDVRDKAFLYWRVMSSFSSDAQHRLLDAPLPPIQTIIPSFTPAVLDVLVREIATLSSVYHKPASTFIAPDAHKRKEKHSRRLSEKVEISDLANIAKQEIINNAKNENLLDFDDDEPVQPANSMPSSALDELDDLFSVPAPTSASGASKSDSTNKDIMGLIGHTPAQAPPASNDLLDLF